MGGAAGVNLDSDCADVAALVQQGSKLILVHGGSDETNKISEQLGHPPRFVTSPRALPAATPTGRRWKSLRW